MQTDTLEKLGRFLSCHRDAIVVGDSAGVIEWANAAWAEMTGYSLEAAIAKPIGGVLLEAGIEPELVEFVANQFTSGRLSHIEFPLERPDGSLVWLHLDVQPILDAAGEPSHFVARASDVSARKRAEAELAGGVGHRHTGSAAAPAPACFDPVQVIERVARLASSLAGPRTSVEFERVGHAGEARAVGSAGALEPLLAGVVHHLIGAVDAATWAHLHVAGGRVRRRVGETEWRDEPRLFIELHHDGPCLTREQLTAVGRSLPAHNASPSVLALAALRGGVESQGARFRIESAPGIGTRVRIEWPCSSD